LRTRRKKPYIMAKVKDEVEVYVTPETQLALWDNLPGEVEVLEEDMGEPFTFTEDAPVFLGVFTGHKKVMLIEGNDRESTLYGFLTADTGEKVSLWGPFQIDEAMRDANSGDAFLFQWNGKREGKGGRTINTFDIRVKRGVA
jgi:hypothetical protein